MAKKYLDIYCKIADCQKAEILKFVPYVAASVLYRYVNDKDHYNVLVNIIEESFANG